MITHAYLREILYYSIITGNFYWLKSSYRVKAKDLSGSLGGGYRRIGINGKRYLSHRLAWFWVTGEWPKHDIDHKNGIPDANYWLNLRDATRSQNCCNKKKQPSNTSGYKGVTWNKSAQKWQAYIMLNRKRKHLGYFNDIKKAVYIRLKAEKELHGDFART